jgi:hypothetical protein
MMQPLQTILVFTAVGHPNTEPANTRTPACDRHADPLPSIVKQASDIEMARAAFLLHCYQDPAWMELGAAGTRELVDRLYAEDA